MNQRLMKDYNELLTRYLELEQKITVKEAELGMLRGYREKVATKMKAFKLTVKPHADEYCFDDIVPEVWP